MIIIDHLDMFIYDITIIYIGLFLFIRFMGEMAENIRSPLGNNY